jgi:uncharacterized damage-inducible protein DinB
LEKSIMPTSNPLDILLARDAWATRNIIETCAKLSPEQFHRKFEMGPGSLHNTATHILGAMWTWMDRLEQREPRPKLEATQRTVPELLKLHGEVTADFAAMIRAHPLESTIRVTRDGKTYTFTRGVVATHTMTHGMHHRAQCLNMLRQLGVTPLPLSSVVEWARMVDMPQES